MIHITQIITASALVHMPIRHFPARMAAAPSFEDALDVAPGFCQELQSGGTPSGLTEFMSTSNGARGFFVHYLTDDDYTCADSDNVPAPLMESLDTAPASTIEVMLMNVVMSSATALAHRRAGNDELVTSCERTCKRASILIAAMWPRLPALRTAFGALSEAVESGFLVEAPPQRAEVDEWVAFLARWKYDEEQTQLVSDALDAIEQLVQPAEQTESE